MKIIDKLMDALSLYDEEEIFDEDLAQDASRKERSALSPREKLAERPSLFRKKNVVSGAEASKPGASPVVEAKPEEKPQAAPKRTAFTLRKPEEKKPAEQMTSRMINLPVTDKLINVIVLEPAGFDDVKKIADHLQGSQPVVVNFVNTDSVIAKRMTDYISGTIYALGGTMKKMGRNILVCAPKNVDIDAGAELPEERSVKKWDK